MKKLLLISFFMISFLLFNCEKDDILIHPIVVESSSYYGTFKTISSENLSGSVLLEIANGYYKCYTSLSFGQGAGKLEANDTIINFIDTLFFIIPGEYGPSYILSGEHYYDIDGENFKLWKKKNVGSIEYNLKKMKTN